MKLFTVGSTQMRQEILDVRHQQVLILEQQNFLKLCLDSDRTA